VVRLGHAGPAIYLRKCSVPVVPSGLGFFSDTEEVMELTLVVTDETTEAKEDRPFR
jgi:hypothetical protein